jgi:hypothetical protein
MAQRFYLDGHAGIMGPQIRDSLPGHDPIQRHTLPNAQSNHTTARGQHLRPVDQRSSARQMTRRMNRSA